MSDRPQDNPDRPGVWPQIQSPIPLPTDPIQRLEIEADLDAWWAARTVQQKLSVHARIALGLPFDLVE